MTVFLWSTVAVAFKLTLKYLDIFQLVFYSTFFAAIILLAFTWVEGKLTSLMLELKRHWRISLLSGCINPVLYYLVLFAAYERLPAQIAQPVNYTWAIVLTFLSIPFLKQKIHWTDFAAALVCYMGVVVIAFQGNFTFLTQTSLLETSQLVGLGLAILSTFIWSSYWILNVRDPRDATNALCLNFIVAVPVALAVCLVFSDPVGVEVHALSGAVYIGFAEMAVAFLFWSKALKLSENTSRVSNLIFLSPFVSLIFIQIFLGESIHGTTYIGLCLIVAGLLFQQYSRRILFKSENF